MAESPVGPIDMSFLDDETYLLETDAARDLYETIEGRPILDPHNHADIVEIVENDGWSDIWEVQGATDHYVWSMMRKRGVDEELITGDASNREKWEAFAEVVPEMAANPVYEWLHLDLKRRFGIEQPVSAETADEIWTETKSQLEDDDMRPQELLREMNVEVLATTDNPTSQLEYHERAVEEVEGVDIRPTWRADPAVNVQKAGFLDFADDLADATDYDTDDFAGYLDALAATHEYFEHHGCAASDLGVLEPVSRPVSEERAAEIYAKRRAGESLSEREIGDLQAYLLEFIGELNSDAGWVSQLHIGALRDYREQLYDELGAASGGDVSMGDLNIAEGLDYYLDRFDGEGEIILYCVDPSHYPTLTTLARAYSNVSVGPAWWFNDSPFGMDHQLDYVGSVDLLANHAGMVSDSRKLLSFDSRFEMFRRTLANVVGKKVERGQIPLDVAEDLVDHVAYERPKELYGF
ncbi:glucuronate isomerase [Halosimplex carlsbadense 2-9-1]|uniref:Uronate isomerase n=2 Tax=Halosimplex carlsbadense TaxID=171164 RepID=M0CP46_9EURY|nr:glucuronate isomerase [Halosimplex carlsbadense 2-9-1]